MKSGKILSIYDFFQHDFLCSVLDAVHSSNPGHLITGFQILCHTLYSLRLLNNAFVDDINPARSNALDASAHIFQ